MTKIDTSRVSPTAHYTSYVWWANGISHKALSTRKGKLLYYALLPLNTLYRITSNRADLNLTLLARHRMIDYLLDQAVATGKINQVIEVAAGLSPRGINFSRRYPHITYIEGDLPEMAATKKRLLESTGMRRDNHHIVTINALLSEGDESLEGATKSILDQHQGVALVTEGIANYFSTKELETIWQRLLTFMSKFPSGTYYTDINFKSHSTKSLQLFLALLGWFSRGRTYLHYTGTEECESELHSIGFDRVEIHHPGWFPNADLRDSNRDYPVCLVEASIGVLSQAQIAREV